MLLNMLNAHGTDSLFVVLIKKPHHSVFHSDPCNENDDDDDDDKF